MDEPSVSELFAGRISGGRHRGSQRFAICEISARRSWLIDLNQAWPVGIASLT
jgi:hypothetical protein